MLSARPFAWFAVCVAAIVGSAVASAEEPRKVLRLLGEKPGVIAGGSAGEKPEVSVTLTPRDAGPGDGVTLLIDVKLPPQGYTYSINPPFTGRTQIQIEEHDGLEPLGKGFVASPEPKRQFEKVFNEEVEKHFDRVSWKRVFRLRSDADPDRVSVRGTIRLQICDDLRCTRMTRPIDVALRTGEPSVKVAGSSDKFRHEVTPDFRGKPGPATVRIEVSPKNAKPGERVTLATSITVKEGWHTYSVTQTKGPGGLPTTINLSGLKGLEPVGKAWRASAVPEEKRLKSVDDDRLLELHHGTIRWTREFEVAEGAKSYGVEGRVRYMTCDEKRCLPPKSVDFRLGDVEGADEVSITSLGAPVNSPQDVASREFELSDSDSAGGLAWHLFFAFVGGMILNVMPCVLPVLAIKVMSFVQQAGESRWRIFALNLAYSGGVILVFLVLASLAVGVGLGWGGLFQNSEFNLVMACVVFAMGLSLLGVFEIPVPGLVGATAGNQQQEGLLGALLTGVLATLLATPCSGPFLGATLGWSVRQSPAIVYLVWTTMGIGMAFPYVVFGMFPHAIKWLPKPGNWMVRMKEFAGFILMGTVIFFIYFMENAYVVPLLVMLLGIGLGLWMLGNLYNVTSHFRHKMTVRITSFALAAVICTYGYSMTKSGGDANRLPWEDFSEARLEASLSENKTVLVDFTADWCLTCKTVEKFSLNTPETKQLVERHDVVTLYADYTKESPEIKRWLDKFQSESVPLTVIFPGDRPGQPIVIRDVYTKSTLLKRLNEAVGVGQAARKQASLPAAATR